MNRSAVFWSAIRNWGPRLGTIVTFFVLARILAKDELGLFAAAAALIAFTEILTENGFSDALIRAPRVSDGTIVTILLINTGLALAIYIVLATFANQIAMRAGIPGLETILPLVGISLILNSLGYVPQALLRKLGQFKRLAFRSIISTVAGAVTGLLLAFDGFGVYAMVGQLLVTAVVNLAALWLPPMMPVTGPSLEGLGGLFSFAARTGGSKFLTFVSTRLVELAIPMFYGPAALALYVMGSRIPAVLAQMLTAVMVDVNLPHLSRFADRPNELREAHRRSLRVFASVALPCFLGIAALAPEIGVVAFGANGHGTEQLIFAIALLGAVQAIGYSSDVLLTAWGKPQITLRFNVLQSVLTVLAIVLTQKTSVYLLIWVYIAFQSAVILCSLAYASHRIGLSFELYCKAIGGFVLAAGAALVVSVSARQGLNSPIPGAFLRGLVLGSIYLATYCAFLWLVDRGALMESMAQFRRRIT